MTNPRSIDRFLMTRFEGPVGFYACILLIVSFLTGYWLWTQGLSLTTSIAIPLVCCGLVTTRVGLLAVVLSIALLVIGAELGPSWSQRSLYRERTFCIMSLVLIVCAFRYQALASSVFPKRVIQNLHGSDAEASRHTESFRPSELWVMAIEVIGCVVAAALWLLVIDMNSETSREYGLLPHGFRAVKLTLSAFVMFLIIHGLLGYGRWESMSRLESTMQLHQEILRWSRHEERLIARQRKRLRKKIKKGNKRWV